MNWEAYLRALRELPDWLRMRLLTGDWSGLG